MKILLDECVPKRLGRLLSEHDVVTTPQVGWAGITNGELLQKASKDFDVFVTVDRDLAFQQCPSNLPFPEHRVIGCRAREEPQTNTDK